MMLGSPIRAARDQIARISPNNHVDIHLDTAPIKKSLRLAGKKGICFTLRQKDKEGSWEENIPKIQAIKPYWNYSWDMELIEQQPHTIAFMPMVWGAWGVDKLQKRLNTHIVPKIKSGDVHRVLGFNEPDKLEQANLLVGRYLLGHELLNLVLTRFLALLQCHEGLRQFAGFVVGHTNNGSVGYGWMSHE